MNLRVVAVVFLCVVGWACLVIITTVAVQLMATPKRVVSNPEVPTEARPMKFLYLVQTEACLPDRLGSVDALGNPLACNCDVLVLGYKEACNDTSLPHVHYLFNSSTTWSSGRNQLYESAMKRSETYLYYIFMDDDIVLVKAENKNPWREFEEFLKRVEPAVAALELDVNKCLPPVYRARLACGLNETTEYLPIVRFDPAFNAFHYQAVTYLLPYITKYDPVTIWASGFYGRVKAELMFRGQVVMHNVLRATNPLHRDYPRKRYDAAPIVNEIEAQLPEKYQKSQLLQEWKRDGLRHQQLSSTLCLPPPPPHMPIKPYAHFEYANSQP